MLKIAYLLCGKQSYAISSLGNLDIANKGISDPSPHFSPGGPNNWNYVNLINDLQNKQGT